MSSPIYMPKLGLTMTEGTLTEWLVNTGETVTKGQPVASIETDKIETEIEAEAEGRLHQLCKSGEIFECGVVLGWVLEEDEEPPETPEIPEVKNDQITTIEQNETPGKETKTKSGRIAASPAAKRLAKEKGLDLSTISGSGPGGRIVVEDVEAFAVNTSSDSIPGTFDSNASQAAVNEAQKLGVDLSAVQASSTDRKIRKSDVQAHIKNSSRSTSEKQESFFYEPIGEGERVQLTGMRKVIANRMHSSLQSMAQLTLHIDVEMDKAISLRKEMESDDELPGYTDFVIASVARALKEHPQVNSQMLEINIGMAVALSDGLVVPVVRNADQLSLNEIAKNTSRLAGQARDGKLALEDLEGGTFSVSSLGMFGVDGFTPVINPPNAAILGVGRIREDIAWDDQTPRKTSRMVISLTWDHRVLDGAPAADFASTIKSGLENPESLLNVN